MYERSTQTWGGRILRTLFGVLVGLLLIIGSFILIFWNEGHVLHTAKSLQQTSQVIITVPNTPIQSENNLKVIYISGLATTNEVLQEPLFHISEKAIKLNRKVEMYQWKENIESSTEKQLSGAEQAEKKYTYEQVWSDNLIDSGKFKDKINHQNPTKMLLRSKEVYAHHVTVGDFILPTQLIHEIIATTAIDLSEVDASDLQAMLNKQVQHIDEDLYVGEDPQSSQIGDLYISIDEALPQTVSIVGQQVGNTLQPYLAPAGNAVFLLGIGEESPQQLIHEAQVENQTLLWTLRLVSLVMMILGISLLLSPLSVLAVVVPILGSIVGFATGLIAFVVGLILWSLATSIAWFAFRPLGAFGLFVIVIIFCYVLLRLRRCKRSAIM